jgi:hypothetical protein
LAEIREIRRCQIRLDETPWIFGSGYRQIPFVDVDADIVDAVEAGGVRSWAAPDVQHPPNLRAPKRALDRRELLRDKRRLPRRVNQRMFEQPFQSGRQRHLTSNLPTDSPVGNTFLISDIRSEDGSGEKAA